MSKRDEFHSFLTEISNNPEYLDKYEDDELMNYAGLFSIETIESYMRLFLGYEDKHAPKVKDFLSAILNDS